MRYSWKSVFWIRSFKRWTYTTSGSKHSVSLEVDGWNTRIVRYDGAIILREEVGHNGCSIYNFTLDGDSIRLVFESAYFSWRRMLPREELFHLYVNDEEICTFQTEE